MSSCSIKCICWKHDDKTFFFSKQNQRHYIEILWAQWGTLAFSHTSLCVYTMTWEQNILAHFKIAHSGMKIIKIKQLCIVMRERNRFTASIETGPLWSVLLPLDIFLGRDGTYFSLVFCLWLNICEYHHCWPFIILQSAHIRDVKIWMSAHGVTFYSPTEHSV